MLHLKSEGLVWRGRPVIRMNEADWSGLKDSDTAKHGQQVLTGAIFKKFAYFSRNAKQKCQPIPSGLVAFNEFERKPQYFQTKAFWHRSSTFHKTLVQFPT